MGKLCSFFWRRERRKQKEFMLQQGNTYLRTKHNVKYYQHYKLHFHEENGKIKTLYRNRKTL